MADQTGHGGHGSGHGGKTGSFGSNKSQKGFSKNTSTPGEKKLTESHKSMPMSTKSHKSTSRSPRISPRNLRSPRISPSPRSPRTSSSKVPKSSQPTGTSYKIPGPSLPSGEGLVNYGKQATEVEVVQPVRSPGEPNSEINCQTVNVDESLEGRSVKSGKIMKVKSGNGTSEVENDSDDVFPEAAVSSTGKTGKGRAKFLEKNDLS